MSTSQSPRAPSLIDRLWALPLTDKLLIQGVGLLYFIVAMKVLRFIILANAGLTDVEIVK